MANPIITNAISAVIALSVSGTAAYAEEMGVPKGTEKCYGIAKAGQNDCSNNAHKCGGEAKENGSKSEWLAVPNGLCNKIVGGSTKSG